MEQIESNTRAFSEDGRNEGAWIRGMTGLNREKYSLTQRFYSS